MSSSLNGNRGPTAYSSRGNSTGISTMEDKRPSGYKKYGLQQYLPEQMEALDYIRSLTSPEGYFSKQIMGDESQLQNLPEIEGMEKSQVGQDNYLNRLVQGDEGLFKDMEASELRKFGELQGNIASRFSGMGQGARNSSGFQNTMNAAASNFQQDLRAKRQDFLNNLMGREATKQGILGQRQDILNKRQDILSSRENMRTMRENLRVQRENLRRQAALDLINSLHLFTEKRPFEQGYVQKGSKGSGLGGIIGASLGGIGGFISGGGPAGILPGAQLGYGIGSQF